MLSKELKKVYGPVYIFVLMFWVNISFKWRKLFKVEKNPLNHELIITLTSYPARFGMLHYTLKCLLRQSIQPDRIILWIAYDDVEFLPKAVTELKHEGLEIRLTDDIRSYKKIIPALEAFPNAGFIITDDDLFYPRNIVKTLLNSAKRFAGSVIAGRVHRVTYDKNGNIAPYKSWHWNSTLEQSDDNFFTGCGSVFFPPQAFWAGVLNRDEFTRLAPTADDIWLNWMLKLKNTPIVGLRKPFVFWDWPDSQKVSLNFKNVREYGNDRQIGNMVKRYGQCYFRRATDGGTDTKC